MERGGGAGFVLLALPPFLQSAFFLTQNKGGPGPTRPLPLRRLERVFCCYIVCETKEDYKEGCLMVLANYMSPCNSIVGLYFKGTCDVISVTMATHKVHKSVLQISVFVNYLRN